MAKLSNTTVLDNVGKQGLSVSSTSNDKNYFEELYSWRPQLDHNDIFGENVPFASTSTSADLNVTNNPTIIEKLTNYSIDMLPSSNGQGYGVFLTPGDTNSTRQKNFLTPQKYGNGYAATIFNDGSPIALTLGQYQIDYANGIIRFDPASTPSNMSWTNLTITIYRYVGEMISTASSSSNIISTSINNQSNITIDSFDDTSAMAARWDYVISTGSDFRAGNIYAVWNEATSDVRIYTTSSSDIGSTSDFSFSIINDNNVIRLRATCTNNYSTIRVTRNFL